MWLTCGASVFSRASVCSAHTASGSVLAMWRSNLHTCKRNNQHRYTPQVHATARWCLRCSYIVPYVNTYLNTSICLEEVSLGRLSLSSFSSGYIWPNVKMAAWVFNWRFPCVNMQRSSHHVRVQCSSCKCAMFLVWGCNISRVRMQCYSCEVQCSSCEGAMFLMWGCNVPDVRLQCSSCDGAMFLV